LKRFLLVISLVAFWVLLPLPAYGDETTINLDQSTPYVDIPLDITQQTEVNVQTLTGLRDNTNPAWVDSWLWLIDSAGTLIAGDDDSNHSQDNAYASKIVRVLETGLYIVRATSYYFAVYNETPIGSYLLSTNLTVIQPSPTPTPTVEPTPEPTVAPEPTPSPEQPSSTPEPTSEPILPVETPTSEPEPIQPEILEPEPEIVEQTTETETIETPIQEPEISIQQQALEEYNPEYDYQINEIVPLASILNTLTEQETLDLLETLDPNQLIEYIDGVTLEAGVAVVFELLDNPAALINEIFSDPAQALEAFSQIGADMTKEVREKAQETIVAAVIVGQIATASAVSASLSTRRIT